MVQSYNHILRFIENHFGRAELVSIKGDIEVYVAHHLFPTGHCLCWSPSTLRRMNQLLQPYQSRHENEYVEVYSMRCNLLPIRYADDVIHELKDMAPCPDRTYY